MKQPDLAKAIESYEPKPDPVQQELQLLQIEKLKLELLMARKEIEDIDSKIVERVSRTEENGIDRETKMAQTEERKARAKEAIARAELLKEQTDALAADFVKNATGQKRAEHELDKEYDAAVKLAQKGNSKVGPGKMSKNMEQTNG